MPNATSGTASVVLETYNGTALTGSNTYWFTVTVPASVVPTVSLAVAAVKGFNGLYLQGVSKAQLTATAGGVQGSTITSYQISGGGYSGSASPYTTGELMTVGANIFTVVVTDSRGRQASASVSITVTAYSRPVISSASAARCTSDGTLSDTGTYIKIIASYSVANVSGNGVAAATVKYAKSGTTSWTNGGNVPNGGSGLVFGSGGIAANASYTVVLTVRDTVGQETTWQTSVSSELAVFEFRSDRAGIGRVAGAAKTLALPEDWTITGGAHQHELFDSLGHDTIVTGESVNFNAAPFLTAGVYRVAYQQAIHANSQNVPYRSGGRLYMQPMMGTIYSLNGAWQNMWQIYITTDPSIFIRTVKTRETSTIVFGAWNELCTKNSAYPVGAVYLSTSSTSPAALFGGTWASITPPANIPYAWKRTA